MGMGGSGGVWDFGKMGKDGKEGREKLCFMCRVWVASRVASYSYWGIWYMRLRRRFMFYI